MTSILLYHRQSHNWRGLVSPAVRRFPKMVGTEREDGTVAEESPSLLTSEERGARAPMRRVKTRELQRR
jgi:hypothetical protein